MTMDIHTEEVDLIDLSAENLESEHICCAIGNDKTNAARAKQKKKWLQDRFAQGHRFTKADLRGKVFIESSPAESSIFPVEAEGYTLIQCYWVSGRYKGHGLGRKLYNHCEAQSRAEGKKGMVAIVSPKKRAFMVDKKILLHYGFETVDEAPPFYQLAVKKFDPGAENPRFADSARRGSLLQTRGLDFFYSPACPFNQDFTRIMADIGREMDFPVRIHRLETREDLAQLPTPWGLFSVFLDGEFLSAEVMTANKFRSLLSVQPHSQSREPF